MILVTGGAGFIGSNFICEWLAQHDEPILNLDALTYAGNLENLKEVEGDNRHTFVQGNILDEQLLIDLFNRFHPRAVIHFAAESHVDRSIVNPSIFVDTNVKGTTTLLNVALHYWEQLNPEYKATFRFINISTDEVYGSQKVTDTARVESDPFNPSSPYSASKAAADLLGNAYAKTYAFPIITFRCTNNFGPKQNIEKLIPKIIWNSLNNNPIPIYGNGKQKRDWIFVSDFCSAIRKGLTQGKPGQIYNISGGNIDNNMKIVEIIQSQLIEKRLINKPIELKYVKDRQAHDFFYHINSNKARKELLWKNNISFKKGIDKTISWFMDKEVPLTFPNECISSNKP